MSWSQVFPVLTDEHVDAFEAGVTAKERRQFDEWFKVRKVINAREVSHIVSTSLFWKNIRQHQPQILIKNRAMVMNAKRSGKLLRFDPWEHYVEPLLQGAHWLHKRRKDAAFRVYLAADMDFFIPDLVAAGCEVHLMASSSIAHNPGAMWRMLALEEEGKLVTIVDADRAACPEADMARTDEALRLGLGWWRVPVWGEINEVGNVGYRPILACQLGSNQSLPIRQIMHALIWHTQHQTISTECRVPGCQPARVHGSIWPDYGYDEWFLQTAVYPRAVMDGILSFVPAEASSRLLPLDIEFTNTANPNSEIIYFGRAGSGCCGPAAQPEPNIVHEPKNRLTPLVDCRKGVELDSTHLTHSIELPSSVHRAILLGRASDSGKVVAWFIPAYAEWNGKRWLAYRFECRPIFQWTRIGLVELDAKLKPKPGTNRVLKLPTEFDGWGAEDPRLFIHDGELILSYTNGWKMGFAKISALGKVMDARLLPMLAGTKSDPLHRAVVRQQGFTPNRLRFAANRLPFAPDRPRFASDPLRFAPNRLRFASDPLRFASDPLRFALNRLRFAANGLRFASDRLRFSTNCHRFSTKRERFRPNLRRFTPNRHRSVAFPCCWPASLIQSYSFSIHQFFHA